MMQALIGLLNLVVAAALIGCVIGWIVAFTRLYRGEPLLQPEIRLPAVHGFAEVILAAGLYLVITIAVLSLVQQLGWIAPPKSESPPNEIFDADFAARISIDGVAKMAAVVLLLGWLSVLDRNAVQRLGTIPQGRDFKIGITAAAMLIPPVMMVQFLLNFVTPYEHPVKDLIEARPTPLLGGLLAVNTVVIAPVAEEFFFRGLLQGWFQRVARSRFLRREGPDARGERPRYPQQEDDGGSAVAARSTIERLPADPYLSPVLASASASPDDEHEVAPSSPPVSPFAGPVEAGEVRRWPWWPLFLNSIFFAVVHWGHGAAPVSLFLLAVGLSYLTRQTGRLWPAITVHFCLNACATAAMFLAPETSAPAPPLGP